jgi:queuine/archaeosine tRNA-ribosyltransferase
MKSTTYSLYIEGGLVGTDPGEDIFEAVRRCKELSIQKDTRVVLMTTGYFGHLTVCAYDTGVLMDQCIFPSALSYE